MATAIVGYIPFKIIVDSLMFISEYRATKKWNAYSDSHIIKVREGTSRKLVDVFGGVAGDDLLENPNASDVLPSLTPNQFVFAIEFAVDDDNATWVAISAGASDTIITDADNDGGSDTLTINETNCSAGIYQSDGTTLRQPTDAISDSDILRITVPDVGDIDVENLRVTATYTAPTG